MERKVKIHGTRAYHYKQVPTLILKGDCLKAFEFNIDTKVSVRLEQEQIRITPVTEDKEKDKIMIRSEDV